MLAFLPIFQLGDILSTASDFSFVIKILVFAFILFQLYSWLGDQPLLFGGAAIIAAYLVFFYSIFTTFLAVLILVLFTNFGYNLQNMVYFGLTPLARGLGLETPPEWGGSPGDANANIAKAEERLAAGEKISDQEANLLAGHYQKQAEYQNAVEKFKAQRFGGG